MDCNNIRKCVNWVQTREYHYFDRDELLKAIKWASFEIPKVEPLKMNQSWGQRGDNIVDYDDVVVDRRLATLTLKDILPIISYFYLFSHYVKGLRNVTFAILIWFAKNLS